MKKTLLLVVGVSFLFLMAQGCSHYKVTDAQSGKAYYTKDVDRLWGGGVKFEDEATEREVRLDSSRVDQISKKEFDQGIYGTKDSRQYGEKWEDTDNSEKQDWDKCD
ncbi:MAG: hypothetical protein A2Y07_05470 [Planctomycetes bacterium GWF2_50_10]|nr:MAG: hypothetical protein A2Y07_05470 [Planctomycetes bacterium GWF2_50_10]